MKKTIILLLVVAIISTVSICFVACDGKTQVEIKDLDMKLYNLTSDGKEEISLDTPLLITKKYQVEFTCFVTSKTELLEPADLTLDIMLPAIKVATANIVDVKSGKTEKIPFTDSEGEVYQIGRVAFSIPTAAGETKEIKVNIDVEPIIEKKAEFKFTFECEAENVSLVGNGVDGWTKQFITSNIKLDTPVVTVIQNEKIEWKHIANASYYKIYVDGEVLKDLEGKEIKVYPEEGLQPGSQIMYGDLAQYISGVHQISIRAFGNKVGIYTSDKANSVEITL